MFGEYRLVKVRLPESLRELGVSAFAYNRSLIEINLPEGITEIKDETFAQCSSLSELKLPQNLTKIGESAFECCSLENIIIPDGVEKIENYQFSNCTHAKRFYLGAGVNEIGWCGATFGPELETIEVSPENKRYFAVNNCLIDRQDNTLILGCKNSKIPAGIGIRKIKNHAFRTCRDMGDIIIPDDIEEIESSAFSNCSGITGISFGKGLKKVHEHAFWGCTSVTNLNIPCIRSNDGQEATEFPEEIRNIVVKDVPLCF